MQNHKFEDWAPKKSDFLEDVIAGLKKKQKSIQAKYFYDKRGSEIFDEICRLEEYYPTRTELSILETVSEELDFFLNDDTTLIEYGSGSSTKIKKILNNSLKIKAYMALDISKDYLIDSTKLIAQNYRHLSVTAIHADYMSMRYNYFDKISNKIVFFPGSTIGNLNEVEAIDLLASTREVLSGNGYALIGIDLRKDVETLKKAYDDKLGVTSQFNKNLITRMNRELGTNLNPENFNHEARYCDKFHRVEMHLVSKINQTLGVSHETFKLRKGESIHTECSHKYSRKSFESMAKQAGFGIEKYWTDEKNMFAVVLLKTR